MLQRIYGTAWFKQEDLEGYLHRLEEARKRDHRRVGRELDLFMFHHWAPGAVFWTDRGTAMLNALSGAQRAARIVTAPGRSAGLGSDDAETALPPGPGDRPPPPGTP